MATVLLSGGNISSSNDMLIIVGGCILLIAVLQGSVKLLKWYKRRQEKKLALHDFPETENG
jgi:galactose-1-phosphate uridylyltransferase